MLFEYHVTIRLEKYHVEIYGRCNVDYAYRFTHCIDNEVHLSLAPPLAFALPLLLPSARKSRTRMVPSHKDLFHPSHQVMAVGN